MKGQETIQTAIGVVVGVVDDSETFLAPATCQKNWDHKCTISPPYIEVNHILKESDGQAWEIPGTHMMEPRLLKVHRVATDKNPKKLWGEVIVHQPGSPSNKLGNSLISFWVQKICEVANKNHSFWIQFLDEESGLMHFLKSHVLGLAICSLRGR